MPPISPLPFIAIAWGTARLDAFLVSPDGRVLDQRSEVVALQGLSREAMTALFQQVVEAWPEADHEVWLAGMIGSGMGWLNVPHQPCPADALAIAEASAISEIAGRPVRISPGLSSVGDDGAPDLLRGEEMAALGLLDLGGPSARPTLLASVPGMHGKWLSLADGKVARFHTAMTVELGKVMAEHALIGQSILGQPEAGEAFEAAVTLAGRRGGLARLLFEVRTRAVAGLLTQEEASSHFWGLLWGADAADAAKLYELKAGDGEVAVVGAAPFDSLVARALEVLGLNARRLDYDALTAGGFAKVRSLAR